MDSYSAHWLGNIAFHLFRKYHCKNQNNIWNELYLPKQIIPKQKKNFKQRLIFDALVQKKRNQRQKCSKSLTLINLIALKLNSINGNLCWAHICNRWWSQWKFIWMVKINLNCTNKLSLFAIFAKKRFLILKIIWFFLATNENKTF